MEQYGSLTLQYVAFYLFWTVSTPGSTQRSRIHFYLFLGNELKSYLVIWREPTIPEASVFSIQMLDKYFGTCGSEGKISDYQMKAKICEALEIYYNVNCFTFTSQTARDEPEQSTSDPISIFLNIFLWKYTASVTTLEEIMESPYLWYTSHKASLLVKHWDVYMKCMLTYRQSPRFLSPGHMVRIDKNSRLIYMNFGWWTFTYIIVKK